MTYLLISNDRAPSNWGEMSDGKKDAELNNIFGEPDGRHTNATQREAEARTENSGRRQNATNERKTATVREGGVTEDPGRESREIESRVSQPDTDPNSKRKTGTRKRWVT